MAEQIKIEASKVVNDVVFGTAAMRTGGTAIIVRLSRSRNAAALAFLAMTPEEAKNHAADLLRLVIAIERDAQPEGGF